MKMSEEMAVRLHRMMWSDMQRELGDCPTPKERTQFKFDWIHKHFPGAMVHHSCFLCEFTQAPYSGAQQCKCCPIKWPGDTCAGNMHYRESPINEILALPARNEKLTGLETECLANNKETIAEWYYRCREELLSKASGLPATSSIEDHVNAIQKKAREEGYGTAKEYLTECSGLSQDEPIFDHVRAIQEKAVEEYFEKKPAAKLATMDVDQAFKQYADEQKASIFRTLAEASGLSAGNESVKAHISDISEIGSKAKSKGRAEMATEIFESLSAYSGVSKDNWSVGAHVKAIQEKAKEPTEPLKTVNVMLADKVNNYKDALSKESGLDRNRPVYDHIKKIHDDSFSFGEDAERERIMDRIGELLNHDFD